MRIVSRHLRMADTHGHGYGFFEKKPITLIIPR